MSAPSLRHVLPLVTSIGEVAGHRLDLLSAEVWDTWWDLRFARVDVDATSPLARRVPPPSAWQVADDVGTTYEVVDAVGRGDRRFSNGEVRIRPTLPDGARQLHVKVDLGPGAIEATVPIPR